MEHRSQAKASEDGRDILDAQLRETYGRVVYTHKTHEKEADILLCRLFVIKLFQVVLPAVSTGGFISTFAGTGWWGSVAGAVCSAMLLALNLYTRSDDLGKRAQQHRDSAVQIWSIREKYLSLITDLAMGNDPLLDVQRRRDELLDELKDIYANAPSTTGVAYKKAHKALNLNEEMTFSAAEVDAFLPEVLRRVS